MRQKLEQFLKKPMVWLFECESWIAARWASNAHKRLLYAEWHVSPPPENFDHQIDLYHQWLTTRDSLWVERGVFNGLALQGGDTLDICCGDGFNSRNFYSFRSTHVIGCDFDPEIIKTAKRKNSAPNVEFIVADVRTAMPQGQFDNIIWDAAIEHFTEVEIKEIMEQIRRRLKPRGVLSGYTLVERGKRKSTHHETQFENKEDLARFLKPHFAHVVVFETIFPSRHNLYFWASDTILPFSPTWPHMLQQHTS